MAISIPLFFRTKFIENHIPKQTMTIKEEPLMTDLTQEKVTVGTVFKKAGVQFFLLFMDFFISFMLYPSIIYQKVPMIYSGSPSWSIFVINVAWAFGDFPGRTLGRIRDNYSKTFLLVGNFLRLFFVFTSFWIALVPNSFTNSVPVILINAWVTAFTNGFFAVAACNSINGLLENNEKEMGGFVMSVLINSGIGLGSMLSLVGFSRLFPN
jgi:hypothetical protein